MLFVVGIFYYHCLASVSFFSPKTLIHLFSYSPFFIGQTDVGMSLISGYTLMLGDFDLEAYTATSSVTSSIALFLVFMYFVNLIMLNLLIAIMGDIFDQIQENAR